MCNDEVYWMKFDIQDKVSTGRAGRVFYHIIFNSRSALKKPFCICLYNKNLQIGTATFNLVQGYSP